MSNLIPIDRFSQITQLSINTLRIYAQDGLLSPTYVDPDSGYPYYNLSQARLARFIRLLSELEMPLEEIRVVIHAEDSDALKVLLKQHQDRIARRIGQHKHTSVLLERLIENKEELTSYTIKVKEVAAQPIVSIRMRTRPDTFSQVIPSTTRELFEFAERQGIRRHDLPRMAIYYEYNEEVADVEIGLPVEKVVAGEGRITGTTIEGGPVAYVMHVGPYEELGSIYAALAGWIQMYGHETNGNPRELFWAGPPEVKNPADYRTEILWPIM